MNNSNWKKQENAKGNNKVNYFIIYLTRKEKEKKQNTKN